MNRTVRLVLVVVGVLVVVLLVAPFLIPVNQFRPTIEERASAALGRKVQIGNLSLSLISGSLGADNVLIGDDPKFGQAPFLTAKSAKVGVEMVPLIFSRVLHVTSVTIERPEVILLHDASGKWNFSSLGGSSAKAAQKPPSSGAPMPAGVAVNKLELRDGRITIGSTTSQKRSVYDNVSVTASDVSMQSSFPVTVTADLPSGGKFKTDGKVGPIDETDASLTPVDAKIDASGANLANTGLIDPSLGLGGVLDLSVAVDSHGGVAQTKGTAKLSKALLVAGGSPASEPVTLDYSTRYDLRKETGVLNPSVLKIGNATSHLSGTYEMKGEELVLNVKQSGENNPVTDLEGFLPAVGLHLPKGASLQSGMLNTNFTLTGPTKNLITVGSVALSNATLAGFDLGSKMSSIAALAGIKSGKDLSIEKLTANIRAAPVGIQVDDFLAAVPSVGRLVGKGTIDSKNNLDFKMAATLATSTAAGDTASPVTAASGLLGKLGGGEGCKSTTIPFLIAGTTSDPKFAPDVGGIASNMLKSQLGCAGSVATGKPGQTPSATDAINGITGLLGKKKPPQ